MVDTELEKAETGSQDGTKSGPVKNMRKRWLVMGIVLLLVLGAGAVAFMLQRDNEKTQTVPPLKINAKTAPTNVPKTEVKYVQMSDQEIMDKVNYLVAAKQYDEAQKLIESQTDLPTSKVKQGLLISVLTTAGKKDEALLAAEKLASQGSLSAGQYRTLGEQYAQAGNKAKAIEYYRKAIDAYTKGDAGNWEAEVQLIEAKIKGLQ